LRLDIVGMASIVVEGYKIVYYGSTRASEVDFNGTRKGIAFTRIWRRRWTELRIDVDRYIGILGQKPLKHGQLQSK